MMEKLKLSPLAHTWILDLDGTIVKHNGYKIDGCDTLLDDAADFVKQIPENDMIIFITSRTQEYQNMTVAFLKEHGIRYDHIIFGAPFGERILLNDKKPSGLETAIAVNVERDKDLIVCFVIDKDM